MRVPLRPALQRGVPGLRQTIDTALCAIEPAIHVVLKNLGCIGNLRLEIAPPPRAIRHGECAGQRLLSVGGHDRRTRAAPEDGVALAAPMFGYQPRALLRIA